MQEKLLPAIEAVLLNWKAHGEPIHSTVSFPYQQFIQVQVSSAGVQPSGCSIDSFQRAIQQIFQQFGILPSEPVIIYYLQDDGQIRHFHFSLAEQLLESGILSANTIIFDNASAAVGGPWQRKLSETWLNRYCKQMA